MQDENMRFLNTRGYGVFDHDGMVHEGLERTAVPPQQPHRDDARRLGRFHGADHVGRISRGGNADEHVPRPAEPRHLPGEDIVEAIIVAHGGEDRSVGGQRHGRIGAPFPLEPTDDLGGEVLGIAGAAAVATDQQLAAGQKRLSQHPAHPMDRRGDDLEAIQAHDVLIDHLDECGHRV
ncbi:hypothetical protein DESC_810202 [Desulfosarcina cetonica]|nr:hypothetical protein DESC_810202 [Desulfosarcina cetonica]